MTADENEPICSSCHKTHKAKVDPYAYGPVMQEKLGYLIIRQEFRHSLENVLNANRPKRPLDEPEIVEEKKKPLKIPKPIKRPAAEARRNAHRDKCDSSNSSDTDNSAKKSKRSLVSNGYTVPLRIVNGRSRRLQSSQDSFYQHFPDDPPTPPKRRGRPPAVKGTGNPQQAPSVISSVIKSAKKPNSLFSDASPTRTTPRKNQARVEWVRNMTPQGVLVPKKPEELMKKRGTWRQKCLQILEFIQASIVVLEADIAFAAQAKERTVPGTFFFRPVDRTSFSHFPLKGGSTPSDLEVVMSRIEKYTTPEEFQTHVIGVFSAWMEYYNQEEGHDHYRAAGRLSRLFNELFESIPDIDSQTGRVRRRNVFRTFKPLSDAKRKELIDMYNDLPDDMMDRVIDWVPQSELGHVHDGHAQINIKGMPPEKQHEMYKKVKQLTKEHQDNYGRKGRHQRRAAAPYKRQNSRASPYQPRQSMRGFNYDSDDSQEEAVFPFRRNRTPGTGMLTPGLNSFDTPVAQSRQPETLRFGYQDPPTQFGGFPTKPQETFASRPWESPNDGFGTMNYGSSFPSKSHPPNPTFAPQSAPQPDESSGLDYPIDTLNADDVLRVIDPGYDLDTAPPPDFGGQNKNVNSQKREPAIPPTLSSISPTPASSAPVQFHWNSTSLPQQRLPSSHWDPIE